MRKITGKTLLFARKYWREIAILLAFLILQGQILGVREVVENIDTNAARAANYASDASDYAANASDYAEDAANRASVCEDLYY